MTEYALLAEVVRSGFTESMHYGSLVGLAPDGVVVLALGVPDRPVLPRSSVKPFQALACLGSGAPLRGAELAIAAGSHTGEDYHVAAVRRILHRAGLTEKHLRCPPELPEHAATRTALVRAEEGPARIRMNCSGKHAAMLSACVMNGWPVGTYLDVGHPLQHLCRAWIEELAQERVAAVAVDGCGAPQFAVSLVGLARAAQQIVTGPVAAAMRAHPGYVGGTGHQNTGVMRALPGVLIKGGAEGVIVAAAAPGHAVAVKVADGGTRATTALALAALAVLGVDIVPAGYWRAVPVLGGGGPVGEIRVAAALR